MNEKESPLETILRLSKGFDITQKQLQEARVRFIEGTEITRANIQEGKIPDADKLSQYVKDAMIKQSGEQAAFKYILENSEFYR